VLEALGARWHPVKGRHIAPHDATFRRALAAVDVEMLDQLVGGWLLEVRAGRLDADQLVLALDGKTLRGASDRLEGRQVHLFSAMVHGEGVVIAQRQVGAKTNEISAFCPLLEPLDLRGALVTADAMHTQRDHARFLVEDKQGRLTCSRSKATSPVCSTRSRASTRLRSRPSIRTPAAVTAVPSTASLPSQTHRTISTSRMQPR
jgi:predicted transposase YbfD/YdcC